MNKIFLLLAVLCPACFSAASLRFIDPCTMDAEQGGDEDEPVSLLWGLDPVFSAFVRLYIKDLLKIRESRQVPGIYFYKNHPMYQVDVLGTVVYKKERDDFYCYGVDDSTGVINCLCWKSKELQDHGNSVKAGDSDPSGGDFDLKEELRKLKEAQRCSSELEIGDLLQVRDKVNDPVMSVQISRMQETHELYRDCYDIPFCFPASEPGSRPTDSEFVLAEAVYILNEFLKEKGVTRFRPYDVEYLIHPLIQQPGPSVSEKQEPGSGQLTIPAKIRSLLKQTLQELQEKGEIFRKVLSQDEVYNVTENDKDLLAAIRDILREDCKRERYAEKGCHVLHILSSMRQRYSQNLSKEALVVALTFLECNSDIISTTDAYYMAL